MEHSQATTSEDQRLAAAAILQSVRSLRTLAQENDMPMLVYLLDMAALEALELHQLRGPHGNGHGAPVAVE